MLLDLARLVLQWHVREVAHGVQRAWCIGFERGKERLKVVGRRPLRRDEFERLPERVDRGEARHQYAGELTTRDDAVARSAGVAFESGLFAEACPLPSNAVQHPSS